MMGEKRHLRGNGFSISKQSQMPFECTKCVI